MEPAWKSEWPQKGLVAALGRIDSPAAQVHLEQFHEEAKVRPACMARTIKGERNMGRQWSQLKKAIDRALDDLHRRHFQSVWF
jgi:hypothetical protein